MLIDLQKNVGFRYIKFHGILSDDMMVVSRIGQELRFTYTLVDQVLDFLLSIQLKPLIQLSFMPKELAENPDKTEWGSFYLNKEECEPGYYDFVFTYEGKAIATLLTRFYNENELTVKSDAELEALINNERIAAGGSANVNGNGNGNDNDISGGGEIPKNVFYAFQDAVGSDGDTWPTAEMWASIGLPALDYTESGENVLLMIANDSLSVTGYADNETLADTLKDLAAMLTDAGLAVDTVNTLTGGEQHVADYEYNGIPLQIRIGSNATAQINIFVSVNQN